MRTTGKKSLSKSKQGQMEVAFNWVYILIAGAIILLFFVGLVVKQKSLSEENLAQDVVGIMESIFVSASVSEQTQNTVDTKGVSDYTLYFDCEDGVSTLGIKRKSAQAEDPIAPLFAPLEIQSSQLQLWSLPYKLPFKVIDFLFVTSPNTKYYFLGGSPSFVKELANATQDSHFNFEYLLDEKEYQSLDPGKNYQVRIVDLDGGWIQKPLPEKLKQMANAKVTAVSFKPGSMAEVAEYYQMGGQNAWKELGTAPIISVGGERNAAKYGAIFSGNDQTYRCNLQKALRRLGYLLEIYEQKMQEIVQYYQNHPEKSLQTGCNSWTESAAEHLSGYKSKVTKCLEVDTSSCPALINSALTLRKDNQDLITHNCIPLY